MANVMGKIYIDGRAYEVNSGQNLLHACLSLGFDLPYFCWHPALGSVGACRQCAVKQFKDEQDNQGKLVMACMTPAAPNTRISIRDPEAVAFRAAVIEGLMLNHPHDCPVCDEGGECHLQDMTVMTGHDYRRYRFEKRTFRNQYLGPFVNHEMNRCIQCYRCVRFYREYAGGHDLNSFVLRDHVFFGRHEDGVLENEFSGNLVEVCPTGVFTDATLKRHYTRKWDLQMAPTICVHCGLGCNVSAGERYGGLRRIVNRYNHEVNGYFICDRGRFGYEFVNSSRRIRNARLKGESLDKEAAERQLQSLVANGGRLIGIGSPRASLESNFALLRLVGRENFFAGVEDAEWRLLATVLQILRTTLARSASLHDVEISDAVLVLGEDITNSAPRMALSLRQSVRQQSFQIAEKLRIPIWLDHAVREAAQDAKGPLFVAASTATRLDDVAIRTHVAAPDDVARLGFAVAHEIDGQAPDADGLSDDVRALARTIAESLKGAKHPLVVSGLSCHSQAVVQAAANVANALCNSGCAASLNFVVPECNSVGLALLGGRPLSEALALTADSGADTVIVLEDDLYRRAPKRLVDAWLETTRHLVVIDHLENETAARAELVLPAATFAESDGTLISNEGRVQRFFRVFIPQEDIQQSWRWLRDPAWASLDDVLAALSSDLPELAPVVQAAPPAEFRMADAKVPRQPHRYSGRTAMLANISVHEPKPPDDRDSPLAFSMEGSPNQAPASLVPFFWSPGWNSIQATNKFQREIAEELKEGDAGLRLIEPQGTALGTYFAGVPPAFKRREQEWLLVPIQHIFGTEELSFASPSIAEMAPEPYLALNADDAARLGAEPGDSVEIELCGSRHRLPLKLQSSLLGGVAGIPAGLKPSLGAALPAWTRISRVSS